MAYPVSLAALMQSTLQRANLEGALSFITPPELIGYINGSIAEWYDEVRGTTWGGQYFRNQWPFMTSAANNGGTTNPPPGSYYALPPDFLSLTSVDVFISQSLIISCRAFQEEQRNLFRWYPVGWLFDQPIFYQLWQNNLVFIPAPQAAFQVQLNYVPTAPVLAAPEATLDSINGWEEFIILDAAIKCLVKDGQTDMIPVLESKLQQQRERIRALAPRRDMQSAEVVHEIQSDYSGWMY